MAYWPETKLLRLGGTSSNPVRMYWTRNFFSTLVQGMYKKTNGSWYSAGRAPSLADAISYGKADCGGDKYSKIEISDA